MKHKKTNPRSRPATWADVERAKKETTAQSCKFAWAILFTVLLDKEQATPETLQRIWREVESLSDSVAEGRVSVADLICVLREEYGVILE